MTGILSHETRAGATYDRGVIMPHMLGIMRHAMGTAGVIMPRIVGIIRHAMGTAGASSIHRRAQGLDKVIHINVILQEQVDWTFNVKGGGL